MTKFLNFIILIFTGRVLVNTISSGMTTFFPKGLIHFQQNLSCKNVRFSFQSEYLILIC